jgi:outer membrane lipoprotein SlyB
MQRRISALVLGLMVAVAACSKHDAGADTTLATDLSLAAQQKGNYQLLDSLSATERAAGAAAYAGAATSRTSAPTRRTSTASRSSGTRTASSGTGTRSAPRTVVVKHPKRDAAIGAAAGAIIGAGTSRNKVKGGVIGAAVGGIIGAVIGNNVDKTTKKVP